MATTDTLSATMGKPSGLKQTECLSTNTFCSRSVQGAVSWCFCKLFFFIFLITSAHRALLWGISTCPHALRQNRFVCVSFSGLPWSLLFYFGRMYLRTRSCWSHLCSLGSSTHTPFFDCLCVCVCVHWQALICMSFSEWCAYIAIHICKGRPTRDLNILNFKLW